jgi:hypothetical protein
MELRALRTLGSTLHMSSWVPTTYPSCQECRLLRTHCVQRPQTLSSAVRSSFASLTPLPPGPMASNDWLLWGTNVCPFCLNLGQFWRAILASEVLREPAEVTFATSSQPDFSPCWILHFSLLLDLSESPSQWITYMKMCVRVCFLESLAYHNGQEISGKIG